MSPKKSSHRDIVGDRAIALIHKIVGNMGFGITLKTGTMPNDQPFNDSSQALDYSRGLCPVADDLFALMVSIGLNQWYSPNDCHCIAHGINKVLAAYCTQDNNAHRGL